MTLRPGRCPQTPQGEYLRFFHQRLSFAGLSCSRCLSDTHTTQYPAGSACVQTRLPHIVVLQLNTLVMQRRCLHSYRDHHHGLGVLSGFIRSAPAYSQLAVFTINTVNSRHTFFPDLSCIFYAVHISPCTCSLTSLQGYTRPFVGSKETARDTSQFAQGLRLPRQSYSLDPVHSPHQLPNNRGDSSGSNGTRLFKRPCTMDQNTR